MKTLRRCERFCACYGIHIRKLSVISEGKSEPSMVENVVHEERMSNLHYLLQLCAKTRSSVGGRACHAQIIRVGWEMDVLTSNMLINLYSKCSLVDSARKKFNEMPVKSLVSWNTMIGALTQNDEDQEEALTLLIQMQREGTPFNEFTISSVLCKCAFKCAILECMQLHAFSIKAAIDSNCFVGTALLHVYAKCSSIKYASQIFDSMPERNAVTWSSMMAGYVQNGFHEETLLLFHNAQLMGLEQDPFMISSAVSACAGLATLVEGKQLHAISHKSGSGSNIYVSSSLIDMYAKCGCIREAYLVFQGVMEVRSIVLWNAMISGFARHAYAPEAMVLFEKMQQRGFFPDEVTYVSVLNACSHMGLYEEGQKYFDLMVRQHKLSPSVLHYSCMVDILGRAGLVHKAYELIERMPFYATSSMWGSLLASCRVYGNIELAEIAAKHLFEMEPNNAGNHILLANVYAANKKWDEVARARKLLRENDLKKERGTSWIEIRNKIHSFTVGERNHPQMDEIYAKLDDLVVELKKLNYKVDTDNDLHDVEESRKQMLLRHHSEKLAITFGLMCLPSGIPIRIMKNLRICGDCHIFMKLMSKFTSREIIVRDTNRFHHFKDGFCSCREFW
ncbi:pentatricopeptide repeat-containing protein At5g04780, mitochondrial [Vigna unguiculata]|uniref:pentatricopeptide repeat-containing protein At5g04780, mitochondrial n=1 Tax=Vigna unguiculata TaxID=3917 RepID=UPI0010171FC9|nr:pentatricopeptide repeat-containing protein At5g04780, mitochondrial [Vigna unguiculata]XP_027935157.1 pentatricopeptide repeat-containing protein At5g04780, mitochondrial [Vigna unguiculata]